MSPRSFYFTLHKSVGVSLFILIIYRIFWRLTHKPPALLNTMKPWEKRVATAAHHGLYFLMFATPLAGIIMSISSKYGISWFGIELIGGIDNKPARELFLEFHKIFGLLILLILFFHIAGAGWRKRMTMSRGADVLRSVLPGFAPDDARPPTRADAVAGGRGT